MWEMVRPGWFVVRCHRDGCTESVEAESVAALKRMYRREGWSVVFDTEWNFCPKHN